MAKFLTTVGNSYHIEQIILHASESLTLVTPFLKLSTNFIERLSDADRKGIKTTLIYGKSELAPAEEARLRSFSNLEILFCKTLHAKCYHNNDSMIITSMNLYEFSEKNNREMGILIDKENDKEIFQEALAEIESIRNASESKKSFQGEKPKTKVKSEAPIKFELHPDFNKEQNFHIPALFEVLKQQYPSYQMELKDSIILYDFPFEGIQIEVDGRIDVETDTDRKYNKLKKYSREVLHNELPNNWNNKLQIYTEKSFECNMDDEGLNQMVRKFEFIINGLYRNLRIE